MKVGDLIRDADDGEIGLVVSEGPGFVGPTTPIASWKVKWPSMDYLCDVGADSLECGIIEVVSESR